MPYKDKRSQAKSARRHYVKFRKKMIARAKKDNARRRKVLKQYVIKYKQSTGCEQCGIKNPVVLEFHHKRDKVRMISTMCAHVVGIETLQKEMAKCVVLCANCHRILHHKQRHRKT